ncbi:MAG: 2-oxoacid:acceptor oxidoreductase family protein [Oscillospiraceae bacterium]|nr:2-oxoacid:acceptor oxidoreductase family protein [Oscillospiraceae bacterium]
MKVKMFFAGSGGQGILAIGQMIAKAAMLEGKEVTWLPSYGPEMRGGTANCTVIVSDKPIPCPLINETDVLVAMNLPSLLKFEPLLVPNGTLFINSSIVSEKAKRGDISVIDVPANEMARELGNEKAANMVMLGAIVRKTGIVGMDTIREETRHMFSGRKEQFLPMNLAALDVYKV